MTKKKLITLILDFIFVVLLIIGDQVTKSVAIANLKGQESIKLIDGVLHLHYLENFGAAFGMLQNQKLFFIFMAAIILFIILFILVKMPEQKKYNAMHICLVLIASGAVGNMIDRVQFGYVVDFIYFILIDFPIFNVADIYVTVGTALLVIFILFYYKEEDFNFIKFKVKNNNL